MPRGIPNDPDNAAAKGGYFRSKEYLQERMLEIQEQLKQFDQREKSLKDLKAWMKKRKLDYDGIAWIVRQMKLQRPKGTPVKSKKPLQPDGKLGLDADFSAAIREARLAKNMTADALGEKLGCTGGAVNNWESRRGNPNEKRREQIIRILGLPAKYRSASQGNGQLIRDGKVMDAKGDPEFRRRIREAREKQGLSAKQVAKKLGISDRTLSSYEVGRYVPHENIRAKVVKFYDLPAGLGAEATAKMEGQTGQTKAPTG